MKSQAFIATVFLLSVANAVHAGTFIPAENESYDTENLRKISFNDDNITVEWTDNGTNQYEFSSLQRILFTEGNNELTEVEKQMAEQGFELQLYPNPVTETLFLKGVPEGANVLLCTENGTAVGIFHCEGNTLQANIGNVKSGIYFLKIGQKAVKFIKK